MKDRPWYGIFRKPTIKEYSMRLTTLLTIVASGIVAVSGCKSRNENFGSTAAPHAESKGVSVSILGINQSPSFLRVTIRIDNTADRTLDLPADSDHPQWVKLFWDTYSANGQPLVDATSFESDWPRKIPVVGMMHVAPFSSRIFHVNFHCSPKFANLSHPCAIEIHGTFHQSSDQASVAVTVPPPRPNEIPDAPWFGG